MIEDQRRDLLSTLDQRHDALVRELDELLDRVERVLVASGVVTESSDKAAPSPRRTAVPSA